MRGPIDPARLRRMMALRGLGPEELAQRSAIAPATVYAWLSGDERTPQARTIGAICQALACRPEDVVAGAVDLTPRRAAILEVIDFVERHGWEEAARRLRPAGPAPKETAPPEVARPLGAVEQPVPRRPAPTPPPKRSKGRS